MTVASAAMGINSVVCVEKMTTLWTRFVLDRNGGF